MITPFIPPAARISSLNCSNNDLISSKTTTFCMIASARFPNFISWQGFCNSGPGRTDVAPQNFYNNSGVTLLRYNKYGFRNGSIDLMSWARNYCNISYMSHCLRFHEYLGWNIALISPNGVIFEPKWCHMGHPMPKWNSKPQKKNFNLEFLIKS